MYFNGSYNEWRKQYEDTFQKPAPNFNTKTFNPPEHHWRPVVEIKITLSPIGMEYHFSEYYMGQVVFENLRVSYFILQRIYPYAQHSVFIESLINQLVSHGLCSQPYDELIYNLPLPIYHETKNNVLPA